MAAITNGMATVTIDGLECEVTYTITAGGTLNGALVGPRSSHGNITSGSCLVDMPKPFVATSTMKGKEEMHTYVRTGVILLNTRYACTEEYDTVMHNFHTYIVHPHA